MVYVGNLEFPFRRMLMSHMVADTLEELHMMADKIGINRKWFQNHTPGIPHYDVCKSKKQLAICYGATEISDREIVKKFKLEDQIFKKTIMITSDNYIEYLPYYIGQPCRYFEVDGFPEGEETIFTPSLYARICDNPDECCVRLYLLHVNKVPISLFKKAPTIEFPGLAFHHACQHGVDIFGLIDAGLAMHKHELYE